MPPALLARNLDKRFGAIRALQDLSLSVEEGSFFGLLGPNGAGKSTFMSIVSGFQSADSGHLELFGQALDPNDMEQKRILGFAPQHIALYKDLSAEDNLVLFAKLCGLTGKLRRERVEQALELAQLADRRKSLVKEYSGGMKRRLNIAVALLHHPKIVLCDEPTVGVDPQSRNAIFDTLLELKRKGLTVLYSTHYMEEAERLCDTIAIIDHGRILRHGDVNTLISELPPINSISCRAAALSPEQRAELAHFGPCEAEGKQIVLHPPADFRLSRFYAWAESEALDSRAFQINRPTLESLFLQLTGRALRE